MNKKEEASTFNEKTLIPVSLVILLVAGIIRVESTSFKANANEKEIEVLKGRNQELAQVIVDVRLSLQEIKGMLNVKPQQEQKSNGDK